MPVLISVAIFIGLIFLFWGDNKAHYNVIAITFINFVPWSCCGFYSHKLVNFEVAESFYDTKNNCYLLP